MLEEKALKRKCHFFSEITSILPSCLKQSIHLSALLKSGLNMHVGKLREV